MTTIKIEGKDFDEDDFLHVLRVKPDPDVFFTYFYDSQIMERIREIFIRGLRQFRTYFCSVLQYLIEKHGQNSITRIVLDAISVYRAWYENIHDRLPNFIIPLFYGFEQTNIEVEDIKCQRKQIKNTLRQLNFLIKSFDRKWGRSNTLACATLNDSMDNIEKDLKNFNAANQPRTQIQLLPRNMNNKYRDPVTNAIIQMFTDDTVIDLLFEK